jgi:hypothetical protein
VSYWLRKLAAAGKKTRAWNADVQAFQQRAREEAQAAAASAANDPLYGVAFASPRAEDLARAEGLSRTEFADSLLTPSGATGYTVGDVRTLLRELDP